MENINLIEHFAEFKDLKNIDRATMMRVLEEVFKGTLNKQFGESNNFDVIINIIRYCMDYVDCVKKIWKYHPL